MLIYVQYTYSYYSTSEFMSGCNEWSFASRACGDLVIEGPATPRNPVQNFQVLEKIVRW